MKQLLLSLVLFASNLCAQSYEIGDYWIEETTIFWTTTNESKIDKFLPQYSTDGVTWKPMGFVDAYGNSTATRNYQYTILPFYDVTYYRLSIRFYDGHEEVSTAHWQYVKAVPNQVSVINSPNTQYFDLLGRICSTGTYLIRRN